MEFELRAFALATQAIFLALFCFSYVSNRAPHLYLEPARITILLFMLPMELG
jgi:hypothetical protein